MTSGETAEVRISIPRGDLAYWDVQLHRWVVEGGRLEPGPAALGRGRGGGRCRPAPLHRGLHHRRTPRPPCRREGLRPGGTPQRGERPERRVR
ncbi:fibronectin type III-like domain-contianing protein [Streptomyces sp. NPDC005373]|uniref:fibronectin type III-like domain-contianing protein n=1 Tax=Streptomyces sp. NPDC005373 TaxID=3156879 RepID=UPI0033B49B99